MTVKVELQMGNGLKRYYDVQEDKVQIYIATAMTRSINRALPNRVVGGRKLQ